MKDIKMSLGEWSENLFRRVKAMFTGLDDRVTALEEGGGGEVNVIESISMNGTNVPPDAAKNVALAETDPTVPAWAKAATKPTYTAAEVGALPDSTVVPTKVSELTNDSGFLTTESDPTVPAWAKAASKPTYTAAEVGALPDPSILNQVDITQADNGLTAAGISEKGDGLGVRDVNLNRIGWCGFSALSNGDTQGRFRVYNYTNGSVYGTVFEVTYHKNGTVSYEVTQPASFRSAIEAQQEVGLYVDAQGYLCQRIRSDA